MQFALMWAVLAFLLNYVPNIGAVNFAVPPMIQVLLFNGSLMNVFWLMHCFLVVHMVIGNILKPRMMGHRSGDVHHGGISFIVNLGMAARPGRDATFGAINQQCKIRLKPPKAVANWRFYRGRADRKVGYRDEATRRYDTHFHFPLNVGPDMYRIVLGKVSTLSAAPLPPGLREQAPQGPRRERWLAACIAFAHAFPAIGDHLWRTRQTCICAGNALWFNLSHSGDDIALLLSDEGEVGCQIEVIRPRANWRWLANAVFSLGEHAEMDAVHLISNWKCSGASGRAKKPSLNSVAAAPGKSSP